MKITHRLILFFAAPLLLAAPAWAGAQVPKPFLAGALAVRRLGDQTLDVWMKRPVPLTQNLAREEYRLQLKGTPQGRRVTLTGLKGGNVGRSFTCTLPCNEGEAKWPKLPTQKIKAGDPRLAFASKLAPDEELMLVGQMVRPRRLETVPLVKLGRTEYVFELKDTPAVELLAKQWWQLNVNLKKELVLVRLTLDNATQLPTQLRVTHGSREKAQEPPYLKLDKWWKFPVLRANSE